MAQESSEIQAAEKSNVFVYKPSAEHIAYVDQTGKIKQQPDWFVELLKVPYEEKYLQVDNAKIHVLHWNNHSTKPKVLLVHGNGAHAHWFQWVGAQLSDKYEVVAMTLSGMGNSDWRDIYTKEVFINDIIGTIRALQWQSVHLAAHSFGGMLGIAAVALHPELFSSLVICDHFTMPKMHHKEWFENRPKSRPTKVYSSKAEIISRFRLLPEQPCVNQYIIDFIVERSIRQVEGGWTWKFDSAIYDNLVIGKQQMEFLHQIQCPKFLIHGAWTRENELSLNTLLKKYYPEDLLVSSLEQAGHHVMLDQPIKFTQALRDRLDTVN